MWVPLNLSRVDIYTNGRACDQWRHEKRLLPLELAQDIQFYPHNQSETHLCILYRHSIEGEEKVKKRKISKDCYVTTRVYPDEKRLKQVALCFLLSVKGEPICTFFQLSRKPLEDMNVHLESCLDESLRLMVIEIIRQVKLSADHHLLSYHLSHKLRSVILPIQGSTRNKIFCWFHHHFNRYVRKGLQLDEERKLEKDGSLSFSSLPSDAFQEEDYQEPHWPQSDVIDERVAHQYAQSEFLSDRDVEAKDLSFQERFLTYEEEKALNSTIIMTALKKIAKGELKDVLNPNKHYPMLIKMWLTNDQSNGILDAFMNDPLIMNFQQIFQMLTDRILDSFSGYVLDEEKLDQLALDVTSSIRIIRKLIMMNYFPENLKSEEGSHRLAEPIKSNVRVSLSLFYDVYDSLSVSISAEEDVGNDFRNPDYYSSYLRAVRYPLMKRLGDQNPPLESAERDIFTFLEGKRKMSELGITDQNARMILTTIKIIDQAMRNYSVICKRTSYQIRQLILQISGHEMTTCEVYTASPNPQNYTDFNYLTDAKSWVNERVATQAKLVIDYNILSRSLSQRLRPLIFATRGNTGVGKSYWVNRFIQENVGEHLQLTNGVLNPDIIKANLKEMADNLLLNRQVYAEGRIIFERILETLTKDVNGLTSTVIDTRLLTVEEFEQVLAVAGLRGANLELLDVDAPIWNSIVSVLNREPFGRDPCVPFEVIQDGFIRARKYRSEFIKISCRENVNYSLYRANGRGQFSLVAQNKDRQFIHCDKSFEECLEAPSEEEMQAIGGAQITDELIDQLDIPTDRKQVLVQWKGYTIREALQKHSEGKISVV